MIDLRRYRMIPFVSLFASRVPRDVLHDFHEISCDFPFFSGDKIFDIPIDIKDFFSGQVWYPQSVHPRRQKPTSPPGNLVKCGRLIWANSVWKLAGIVGWIGLLLVGGFLYMNDHDFYDFPETVGNFIIPTDEVIYFSEG